MTAAPVKVAPDRLAQVEALAAGGFVLVPVPAGTKGPRAAGWNADPAQWITTPSAAHEYLTRNPGAGVGLLHAQSGTAALDVDSEHARAALAAVGLDLDALLTASPYRIRGKRGEKPLYRVPDGLSLRNKALSWPDPSGKKGPGGRPAPFTLFELRAGPVQDVLPPSLHPDTGQPYTWAGPVPVTVADLPELPPALLALWERWAALEPVMKGACPWAPAEPPAPSARALERLGSADGAGGVVDTFNEARTLAEVLNAAGYKGGPRGPWLYPGSSSGHAGVRLRPERTPRGAEVVMSWHAADPLGDGLPRDAFGVWVLLEHGVDLYAATPEQRREVVRLAARHLGLPEPERGSAEWVGKSSTPSAAHLPALDWGEVRPLPPVTLPVPPLPSEMLPASLSKWIQEEARAAGLPLEMVAGPVFVGAGGLIGRRLTLRNAPNAPAVPCNLTGAVCGPPSVRKTYAVNLGGLALERAERAAFERLDLARPQLETAREVAEARLEALQGNLKRALKGGKSAPPMPGEDELTQAREELADAEAALRPPRYAVSDATIEKLGIILEANPDGVTLLRDELTAWLKGFEKPGRESERAQYLELLNGDAVLRVDRMSRDTLYVRGASLGVLGSIQPGPLAELLDAQRGAGDGLLQRFQVFIWPDAFPPFDQAAQRQPLSPEVRARAAAVLDVLPTLTLETLGSTYPSGDGAPLTYTPDAQAVFDTWEVEHAQAVRDPCKGEAYRSHLGKQPGTFARLALLFHALEVAAAGGLEYHPHPAQVGEEPAALAGAWCEYLTAHARKLWREGRRVDVQDARAVLGYIERGRIQDGQKVSEVRRVLADNRAGFTGERLRAALGVLEACGAVKVDTPPAGEKGGRPSPVLRVHPDALAALDRAEDEVGA